MAGHAFQASRPKTSTNAIAAQRISLPSGRIGFFALTLTSEAASNRVANMVAA